MELSLPEPCSVGDLLSLLEIELHPEDLILAVNGRMADTTLVLKQGDRVDLIPAISGG
jgi:sulfur carrier protein ThiS